MKGGSHDEKRRIPGIAVVTEPFLHTAAAMAATWGLPGLQFLDVRHPIATLATSELDERADRLALLVVDLPAGR